MKKFYEEYPSNKPLKSYDELSADLEVASPNEIVYASVEAPIIGTYNLKNGIAVILINGDNEHALGHFTSDFNLSIYSMLTNINLTSPLKIIIIPGSNTLSQVITDLITFLKNKNNVMLYNFDVEVANLQDYDMKELEGIGFAYDTRTKKYLKPNYSAMLSPRRN